MKAKANLFRTLLVLPVLLVAVAVALFGLGLRTAETQTTATKMQNLGTIAENSWPFDEPWGVLGSAAGGINASGQVVGASGTGSRGVQHAFLKESGQPMSDLNTSLPADTGWTIAEATAINSDGKIAATGYKDGVGTHALLLNLNGVDTSAPTVSSVSPDSGATGWVRNPSIWARWSEKMDPATLTTSTVTLVKDGTTTPISATVFYDDYYYNAVTLTPSSYLDANTKYTVKIKGGTNGVKDLAGNQLGGGNQASGDYWWTFTTGNLPADETTKPKRGKR